MGLNRVQPQYRFPIALNPQLHHLTTVIVFEYGHLQGCGGGRFLEHAPTAFYDPDQCSSRHEIERAVFPNAVYYSFCIQSLKAWGASIGLVDNAIQDVFAT